MTFTSVTDMYFVQTGLTNVMAFTPARYFNVSTTWINFAVSSITNDIPFQPVRFQDTNGVSFNNTFIYNDGSAPQPLDCNISGALIINDNLVVNGNVTIRGYLFTSDNYQECYVPPTTTSPTTAPSDRRVKRDIARANTREAYERITHMPLKSWMYTPEYLNTRGRPPHLQHNTTYVGVVAQDIARDFGYMVSKGRAALGDSHLPDMHSLHPELLYGEMVGALQHMRSLHEDMERRLQRAEATVDTLASKGSRLLRHASREVASAFESTGHDALIELGNKVERGEQLAHSATEQIHKAISYLHSRLQRLERAVVD